MIYGSLEKLCRPDHSCSTITKWNAHLDRPGTRLPCVPLPDHRMENDFSPPIPYTLGYSATSKSTDSLYKWLVSWWECITQVNHSSNHLLWGTSIFGDFCQKIKVKCEKGAILYKIFSCYWKIMYKYTMYVTFASKCWRWQVQLIIYSSVGGMFTVLLCQKARKKEVS